MSEILTAALEYTHNAWAVLPLKIDDSKEPMTPHGFYDASIDETTVERLFALPANLGIRVGPESDLFIVDVDNKKGKEGTERLKEIEAKLGALPETYTVETRYGEHRYYHFPKTLIDNLIKHEYAEGVDIKSDGYVVAPPSAVGNFTYSVKRNVAVAELPESWVKEAIKKAPDLKDWESARSRGVGPSLCDTYGIGMGDVLTLPSNARKVGNGFLIKHPIHDATGKGNLSVDFSQDLWYCHRCKAGGDPVKWVAVREGLIKCAEASQPLSKEDFLRVKDVLRAEGLVEDATPVCERTHTGQLNPLWDVNTTTAKYTLNGQVKTLKLPKIPIESPSVVVKAVDELLRIIRIYLHIYEDYNVTAPMCAALSNFLDQEPDIFGLIMPSGATKTELIDALGKSENQFCYPVSKITEHTFVSGMRDTLDMIPQLRGRLITMKDLTTIMGGRDDLRSLIFQQFRDITDCKMHADFGSGVHKDYDVQSSVLFGATREIERYYSIAHALGARMIFFKPQNDPIEARKASNRNRGRIREMRKTIHDAVIAFIGYNVDRMRKNPLPTMTEAQENEIGELCDIISWLRASVPRDWRGNIDDIPDPEFPTRLSNVITKLTQTHAFIYGRAAVNKEDMVFARRVAIDNIPTKRAAVLRHLTVEWTSTQAFARRAGINDDLAAKQLDEFVILNVCEKVTRYDPSCRDVYVNYGLHENTNHYKVTDEWAEKIKILQNEIHISGRIEAFKEENKESESVSPSATNLSNDPLAASNVTGGKSVQEYRDINYNREDKKQDPYLYKSPPRNISQHDLTILIRREIQSKLTTPSNGDKSHHNRAYFIASVAASLRRKRADLQNCNFEAHIGRLLDEDQELSAHVGVN